MTLNLEDQPGYVQWVVVNDPVAVKSILKNGKTLETSHIKAEDWPRGDKTPHDLFAALQRNAVSVGGVIRDFNEWSAHWDQIRKDRERLEDEIRHQNRLDRARQAAIDEVRRLRPNQLDVQVVVEESPPRIESLSDSSAEENSVESEQFLDSFFREFLPPHNNNCCRLNTDCKDPECKLVHF